MQINSNNPSFGAKLPTIKVLESVTLKNIESETITDLKPVIDMLWPYKIKATGNKGYRYFLSEIGKRITGKYQNIAKAAETVRKYTAENPKATRKELQEFVKPIIKELGETVDITI